MAVLTVSNTLDNIYGTPAKKGSLRAAIEAAKSGDTIRFDPSLANQTIALKRRYGIDKDITLDGSNAPGLTLDGGNKTIILQLDGKGRSFTIRGLTLVNGYHSKYNGAALRVMGDNSKVRVENSEFKDNFAGYGAAISAKNNVDVTVLNSKFSGNAADRVSDIAAGAISVFGKGKLIIKGSEFINNKGVSGGAVSAIFIQTTVENSVFKNNRSERWSGALHIDGASIPAQERYYKGNKPRDKVGGNIIVRNSRFEGNATKGIGGAVGIWGYDQDFVTLEGNDFIGNEVTRNKDGKAWGGALRVDGKNVTVKDSNFINNKADEEGGALWYQGESSAKIINTTFSGNKAPKGGAIYNRQWNGPGTNIDDSTFKGNQASVGGAIYKLNPTPLTITDSKFEANGSKEIEGNLGRLNRDAGGKGVVPISSLNKPLPTPTPTPTPTNLSGLYEAEAMSLTGYKVEAFQGRGASGGKYISLRDTGVNSGKATGIFQGKSGTYRVTVSYYDENDGQAKATVRVAGQTSSFTFDQDLPSDSATQNSKTAKVIHSAIKLKTGDSFELSGKKDAGEFARFDYIRFTPVEQAIPRSTQMTMTNDVLVGVDPTSAYLGRQEQDVLIGGKGADTFQLGDEKTVYYDDGQRNNAGLRDYALIKDFNLEEGDTIVLHGEASGYQLRVTPFVMHHKGLGIFHTKEGKGELIGVIENRQPGLSLTSNAFKFV